MYYPGMKTCAHLLCSIALLLGLFLPVTAQTDSGELKILVVDSSEAAVPGTEVRLTNTGTNVVQARQTGANGYAVFTPLQRGTYSASVIRTGFKEVNLSDIVVNVAESRMERIVLQPSAVAETVEIRANAIALQTEEGSVGQVVQGQAAVALPLQQRRYTELALLAPGVTTASDLTPTTRGPGWFVANGNYQTQNNFMLDGFDNNQGTTNAQSLSAQVVQPSPDSIDEFKVQTNSYSAEFGKGAGAVINVSLKSGTNQVHGSGWYYNRDQSLAANSWTNNLTGQPVAPLAYHQFGGTIGGPILKNRLFYFGDYEGFHSSFGDNYIATVPTTAERNGVFPLDVIDPSTGSPFPNRTIPQDRFDPIGKKLVDLYPAANLPGFVGASGRTSQNYGAERDGNENTHKFDAKTDYYVSDKNQFAFRYSFLQQRIFRNPIFPGLADCGSCNTGLQYNRNQSIGGTWTRLISPTMVNVLRFGYNRTHAKFANATDGLVTASGFGFTGLPDSLSKAGLPRIQMNNYSELGTRNFRPQFQSPEGYQILDTLSLVRGGHTLKAGIEVRWKDNSFQDIQRTTPQYRFRGRFTGDSVADLFLGDSDQFQIYSKPVIDQRQEIYAAFVQDDWKVTPSFTLNLGVRYEYATPYYGASPNRNINFNPATGQLVKASGSDKYLENTNPANFAPRVGFAWQAIPNRVVLRGGYGIFYSGEDIFGSDINLPLNPTQLVAVTLDRVGNGASPLRLSQPIPAGILENYVTSQLSLRAQAMNWTTPRAQQWNMALQFLLPHSTTFELAYVGNKGSHLIANYDVNQTPFGTDGTIAANRPFSQWNQIYMGTTDAQSKYNAFEVKIDKRFTSNWYLLTSYTYASGTDESGAWGSDSEPQLFNCFSCESGPMRQVPRHRLTVANVYQLPFGRGRRFGANWNRAVDALLGGWQVSQIFTARAGLPVDVSLDGSGFDPILGQDISFLDRNNGDGDLRPNRVGRANTWIDPHKDRFHFLNVNGFALQPTDTPGNSQRNVAVGPRFFDFDLGIQKQFQITERFRAEIRGEAFNLLNHTNFKDPANTWGDDDFGVISDAYAPRVLQLAVRFQF